MEVETRLEKHGGPVGLSETSKRRKKTLASSLDAAKVPYYLSNFELVLHSIVPRHERLFSAEELLSLKAWEELPLDSRKLFVRLFQRKAEWFSPGDCQLRYSDEMDVAAAVSRATDSGMIDVRTALEHSDLQASLLSLFSVSELAELVRLAIGEKAASFRGTAERTRRAVLTDAFERAVRDRSAQRTLGGASVLLNAAEQCLRWKSSAEYVMQRQNVRVPAKHAVGESESDTSRKPVKRNRKEPPFLEVSNKRGQARRMVMKTALPEEMHAAVFEESWLCPTCGALAFNFGLGLECAPCAARRGRENVLENTFPDISALSCNVLEERAGQNSPTPPSSVLLDPSSQASSTLLDSEDSDDSGDARDAARGILSPSPIPLGPLYQMGFLPLPKRSSARFQGSCTPKRALAKPRSSASRTLSSTWATHAKLCDVARTQRGALCLRVAPTVRNVFKRVHTLFFMGSGDLSLLFLMDVNRVRFPTYPIPTITEKRVEKSGDTSGFAISEPRLGGGFDSVLDELPGVSFSTMVFHSRTELLSYEKAARVEELVDSLLAAKCPNRSALSTFLQKAVVLLLTHCSCEENDPFEPIFADAEVQRKRMGAKANELFRVPTIRESLSRHFELPPEDITAEAEAARLEGRSSAALHFERARHRPFLCRFTMEYVYTRMVHHIVPVLLEQNRKPEYGAAIAVWRLLLSGPYCKGRRGKWWIRISIDLEHLKRKSRSLLVAEAALKDPCTRSGDLVLLQRRVIKLSRPPLRLKIPLFPGAATRKPPVRVISGHLLNYEVGHKSIFEGLADGQPCSVEQLALQHYALEGWEGRHCESSVYRTLFSLLFWDVLFMHVPGVFQTPFQDAPLDLGTDAFYASRHQEIERRLGELEVDCEVCLLRMEGVWEDNEGTRCRGLNWEFGLPLLLVVARCLGGTVVARVCRLLAEDYGSWGSGMADLLLWKESEHAAKVVEVKGPRDRLSGTQRAWIHQLAVVGCDVEVCRVIEEEGHPI